MRTAQTIGVTERTYKKQIVQLKVSKQPVVGQGMTGVVISHPLHKPGTEVATSNVLSIQGNRVETKRSIYELTH
jgi:hypothetical protein